MCTCTCDLLTSWWKRVGPRPPTLASYPILLACNALTNMLTSSLGFTGHLPRVYEEAHKFHHYLHGSTAFDAHIYGSGTKH